jgi:hypothetical protein
MLVSDVLVVDLIEAKSSATFAMNLKIRFNVISGAECILIVF